MKIIVARLITFVCISGIFTSITLSGCGVRGPLYVPTPPVEPEKPALPEPKGIQWIEPAKPTDSGKSN